MFAGSVAAWLIVTRLMTLSFIWLSSTIQIDVLKHETAWFPLKNPALVPIPLSFAAGILETVGSSAAEDCARPCDTDGRRALRRCVDTARIVATRP